MDNGKINTVGIDEWLKDKELLKYVKGIKSIQTLRRHLDNLTTLDLITLVSKKPLIRTISNTIKEVLD